MKLIRPAGLSLPFVIFCALAPAAHADPSLFLRRLKNPFRTAILTARLAAPPLRPARRPGSQHPQPLPPRATPSHYIHTASTSVFGVLGCQTGKRRANGMVILDFGRLGYNGHSYGTLMFSKCFATNRAITAAMKAYARGYSRCLPRFSRAQVILARGTSKYAPHVPSVFEAGRRWARKTVVFARFLRRAHLTRHVRSAAADDAAPDWDRTFWRTRDFYRGYRSYKAGYLLYNYGSLDGGVGPIWNARQLWFVTGGMRYARPIPVSITGRWPRSGRTSAA